MYMIWLWSYNKINFNYFETAITYQWVRTAHKKLGTVDETGVIQGDQRGKHSNRPFTYPEILKNMVRSHISSFPVMESHYCRENSHKKYLDEALTINKMYSEYLKWIPNKKFIVSRSMYYHIFNTEFNYGIYKPKKDR